MATAVPAGIRIARRHKIDVVLSTSPPPSAHLAAGAIATATRLPWVADFRDSWLANPHRDYEKLGVRAKRVVEERMARSVGRRATRLVAATGAIGEELGRLHPTAPERVTVIENGADFDDFDGLPAGSDDGRMTIIHAGSFFGKRTPRHFLQALRELLDRRPELDGRILARFVGEMRPEDRVAASRLGLDGAWEETGFLSYGDALAAQRAADALLLLIPDAGGRGDTVLSGKVFEYIAAARPILAAVPPGGMAADLVRRSGSGEVADGEDAAAVSAALERLADRWLDGGLPDIELAAPLREELSRRSRARDLAEVLKSAAA
jgi:glycosyltransferase involved in cell wall biosynthesis